jgi:hypothetical protein
LDLNYKNNKMALKSELKKVIAANTKYNAVKVWNPEISGEDFDGTKTMRIEITIRKKKK